MPGVTYTPIASTTLSSNQASVTFNSFAGYRDLILVARMAANTNSNWFIRFNSDSGNNYNYVIMAGSGSSTGSLSQASLSAFYPNYFDTLDITLTYNAIIQVMDYAVTDKHKSVLVRTNKASSGVSASAARWTNTAAITSITLNADGNQFASGSTFNLFGVIA